MWMEPKKDGKVKFVERYIDPYTEKYKKISVTYKNGSPQNRNKAQRELNERIEERLKINKNEDVLFSELSAEWKNKYKHTVKNSTYLLMEQRYRYLDNGIKPDYLVRNITTQFLQKLLEKLYYEQGLSFSTVASTKSILNGIFSHAITMDVIDINPVSDVKVIKKVTTYEDVQKTSNKYLEHDELKLLLDTHRATKHGERYSLFEFLALTGLRYGECMVLKFNDVKKGYIEIEGTLDYHGKNVIEQTKSTPKNAMSYRNVDLSERAIEILEIFKVQNRMLSTLDRYDDQGYIFTSRKGNPVSLANLNNSLWNLQDKIGMNKRLSTHIFRHTHISILSELGVPLKAIMDRVGHVKPETTLEIYTHVTKKTKAELILKLNNYII